MKSSAIVFDLDGTLIDTAPDLWRATNHVLAKSGRREISLDEVRAFVGHGARSLLTRGFAATGAPLVLSFASTNTPRPPSARTVRPNSYYPVHIVILI